MVKIEEMSRVAKKHVCVIGAGASGITCIKECLASGFDVTCYEKGSYLGGLWRYHDSDEDGIASVMRSTIINSSKEMSAYSDFPPPAELPNYMHNSLMIKYLEDYAKKAGVAKYVTLHTEVVRVQQAADYEMTGRWSVKVQPTRAINGEKPVTETVFDAVMVCTGHHVKPLVPQFKNQNLFKGRIVHTHSYKKPQGYEDQNVVVVGVGNSGGDAAAELSAVATQVYLSTRRGVWMLYRVGPNGEPFDSTYLTHFWDTLFKYTPWGLKCSMAEAMLNQRFDHEKYGLKPKHRVFGQHPMVNDALPNRILSGTVLIKDNIREFVEHGVIFEGEETMTPVDSVILATGYEVCFPFLDETILWTENNEVELYKYMFNPKLSHPETLAFIGLIQAVGPAIPVSEMQARWHCHLLEGKSKLPSVNKMLADIDGKRKEIAGRYFQGPRHTMQIDWIPFLDELAEQFGAKPNLTKLAITDPQLWYHLYFGPSFPYQYRLEGPGAWSGARQAIIEGQSRIEGALVTKASLKAKRFPVKNGTNGCAVNGHNHINGSASSLSKEGLPQTLLNRLINVLFVLLSFFPTLISGAKYVAILSLITLLAMKLFPGFMTSLIAWV